jgi:tripartite-type tricarboxylate transporter receptor subunit TctC
MRHKDLVWTYRCVVAAVAALQMATVAAAATTQEDWPTRTIRFVIPFGPGGANDLMGRLAAEGVSKVLGQPVIVVNKPGSGAVVGTDLVAKSAPDGYTFLIGGTPAVTSSLIRSKMPYKDSDLVPVVMIGVAPSVIVVAADSPMRTLQDLVAQSKTSAQTLNFATAGTASTPDFVAEMLKSGSGAKLEIIPYKSGSDSVVAVIGHQTDATSEASIVVLPQIKGGKLRALASTWTSRISAAPDLSTATEQGFPDVQIGHWTGVLAPRGVPDAILDKMTAAVNEAIKSPEIRDRMVQQGIEPIGGTRDSFARFISEQRARLGKIAKSANMHED